MNQSNAQPADERIKAESFGASLLKRPELGAIAGVILVVIFFLVTADSSMFTLSGFMNYMTPAAQLGILAIGAAMLMIGGEFDLSIGSMIAFAGLFFAVCTVNWGLPLIVSIPATFIFAGLVGAINGTIVIRSGLPSFIVTLAFLFILRGLSLVGLKLATGGSTQLRGVREAVEGDWLAPVFSGDAFGGLFRALGKAGLVETFSNGTPKVPGIPIEIVWFIMIAIAATYVLLRTPIGNWIFASGGDANAASNSGVPVRRVKISLFMLTACCAALVAIITVIDSGSDRCPPRLPEGIRGDHRGGDRRLPPDRRLRFGDRRLLRRDHLRHGGYRADLHRLRPGLVPGVPRRHAPDRGSFQQRDPQARNRGALI